MRAQGFRGYKIHPPADVAMCIEICRTLRAELGDDYPLMLDASSLFDVYDGMKIATAVDELRLEWIEDPIAENDIYNYAKLRNCTKTPLMATEYSGGEFAGFAPWLVAGATDYLRGDVLVKGGGDRPPEGGASGGRVRAEPRDPPRRQFVRQHRAASLGLRHQQLRLVRGAATPRRAEVRRRQRYRARSGGVRRSAGAAGMRRRDRHGCRRGRLRRAVRLNSA